MHGRQECAGNVQELCMAKYHPDMTFGWRAFVRCLDYHGTDQIGLPEVAVECADTLGIDWSTDSAGRCAGEDGTGNEGVKLLQKNVHDTIDLGIKKSCTIMISGKTVCIRDGTWYSCEGGYTAYDFIRQINEEYDRLNGH